MTKPRVTVESALAKLRAAAFKYPALSPEELAFAEMRYADSMSEVRAIGAAVDVLRQAAADRLAERARALEAAG